MEVCTFQGEIGVFFVVFWQLMVFLIVLANTSILKTMKKLWKKPPKNQLFPKEYNQLSTTKTDHWHFSNLSANDLWMKKYIIMSSYLRAEILVPVIVLAQDETTKILCLSLCLLLQCVFSVQKGSCKLEKLLLSLLPSTYRKLLKKVGY